MTSIRLAHRPLPIMDLKPMFLPLELVLNVITCSLPRDPSLLLSASHPTTQTLLAFTLVCHETRRVASRYLRQHCVYLSSEARLRSLLLQLPQRSDLRNIPSILLAPFGDTLDDQPTATFVRELFHYTSGALKRLIIDIPLRSLRPEDDHLDVRRILREGFLSLENLEEFVSVRDELYLSPDYSGYPLYWKCWPKLRRLALYNVDADAPFWRGVASMPKLRTLVLTRADGLPYWNIKQQYCKDSVRPIKVLLVNVEEHQIRYGNLRRQGWDRFDPQKKMSIMTYNVPSLYVDEDPIEICQEYVKTGAENGTLWSWEGEMIQHMPNIGPAATAVRLLEPLDPQ